jgi:hypothetical protein
MDQYLWNNRVCLQFLIEGDIDLKYCSRISFTDHHEKLCSREKDSPCDDKVIKEVHACARFIAYILSNDTQIKEHFFREESKKGFRSNIILSNGIKKISSECSTVNFEDGRFRVTDAESETIVKASLIAYANNDMDNWKIIAGLYWIRNNI